MTNDSPPVILLGGRENALSVARSLHDLGARVIALGDPTSPARYSRRVSSYRVTEGPPAEVWLAYLRTDAPEGALLFPCSDDGLELIAEHTAELAERGLVPIEADQQAVLAMLDKQRTYEIGRAAGIGTPRTARATTLHDAEDAAAEIGFPCALKPVHIHEFSRHFRRKLIMLRDRAALASAFRMTSAYGLDMILTEIIPGGEERYCSYFSYLDEKGEPLFDFAKRKLRQYPVGFGGGTYHLVEWADDVAEAGLRLCRAAGLRGLANVEFKRDPRDGVLKLIECNARFTGGNEIVRKAGVDIAAIAYSRMTGRPLPVIPRQRDGVRMWYPVEDTLALLGGRRTGQLTVAGWVRSLWHRQTFPVWSLSDPLPSLMGASAVFSRASRRVAGRNDPLLSTSPEAVIP
ncbi:MAG TPA: ATP-grasp domain-containing protein [Thermoleophilia bacterium]|nr:ATP-grasp domain-containing protein [Thermoleophilia bacterium]